MYLTIIKFPEIIALRFSLVRTLLLTHHLLVCIEINMLNTNKCLIFFLYLWSSIIQLHWIAILSWTKIERDCFIWMLNPEAELQLLIMCARTQTHSQEKKGKKGHFHISPFNIILIIVLFPYLFLLHCTIIHRLVVCCLFVIFVHLQFTYK